MSQVESLLQTLQISESSKHVVSKVFSKLDEEELSTWFEKLHVKDGKVVGTFYSDIGAKLAFNDFIALYQALGYDFAKIGIWRDWWCYGALGCTSQPGYTCNPDACP